MRGSVSTIAILFLAVIVVLSLVNEVSSSRIVVDLQYTQPETPKPVLESVPETKPAEKATQHKTPPSANVPEVNNPTSINSKKKKNKPLTAAQQIKAAQAQRQARQQELLEKQQQRSRSRVNQKTVPASPESSQPSPSSPTSTSSTSTPSVSTPSPRAPEIIIPGKTAAQERDEELLAAMRPSVTYTAIGKKFSTVGNQISTRGIPSSGAGDPHLVENINKPLSHQIRPLSYNEENTANTNKLNSSMKREMKMFDHTHEDHAAKLKHKRKQEALRKKKKMFAREL